MTKLSKFIRGQSGFGLAGAMAGVGLVSVAITALLYSLTTLNQEQKRLIFLSDANTLATTIANTLSDPGQCKTSFDATPINTINRVELTPTATNQDTPTSFSLGGIPSTNFFLGNAKYVKSSILLQNSITSIIYNAVLLVEIGPKVPDAHLISTIRRIPLKVTMIDNNVATSITGCSASNLIFTLGNASSFGAVGCPNRQVLAGISSTGAPVCKSIFDLLPTISCAANEYVGINPTTQNLFCISSGGATGVKTPGGGCTGTGCITNDGGPCYGTGCQTNGSFCDGTGCIATNTF